MKKIKDAIKILKEMGLPKAQQNERSALTLLALVDLKKSSPWETAKKRIIRIHDILTFIEKAYGKRYAENTRETIRRQTLHQFVQAGIAAINPDDLLRPTNSPNTVYEITDEALSTIKKYNTAEWTSALNEWISKKGKLIERYGKVKKDNLLTLELSSGKAIKFSPGKHNELQIKIVKGFIPRFCPKARLVYVGDTARKILFIDEKILNTLGISITEHDKLPDVVLYDETKNQIFLIEAVTAHGPISPKRQIELENILKNCRAIKIYISVFPDFRELKRHIDNIAWESEGWIADNPDHMIHFNGPKFFSAY